MRNELMHSEGCPGSQPELDNACPCGALLSDEELFARARANPETQKHMRQAVRRARRARLFGRLGFERLMVCGCTRYFWRRHHAAFAGVDCREHGLDALFTRLEAKSRTNRASRPEGGDSAQ